MKKISQTQWKRYKESAEGKEVIELFEKALSSEFSNEEMLELAKRFNPEYFKNASAKEIKQILSCIEYYDNVLKDVRDEAPSFESGQDYVDFYFWFMNCITAQEDGQELEDIPQQVFKMILSENMFMSLMLYAYLPDFFMPNLFVMQFAYLKRIADKYEIELPKTPKRSDYKERNFYYLDMCIQFVNFANENELTTPEMCAFLYDYELPVVKEEMENEDKNELPEYPGNAWILVGNYSEGEKEMAYGFWQANELTEKGDILLFYEKSPVKKLNSVWIAQQNGVVDPFFYYYSNTYIGNKITIPEEQTITFEDFKASEYFTNRDKKGNFVSKNFQDVSGWRVSSDDYKEIKRMLEAKGFDTSVLPSLYEPKTIGDVTIELEEDVSQKLLIPLLEQMGWKKDVDFRAEVEFNAGRTKTNHSSDKRPDFCLHITQKNDDIEAKVAIEVKKFMKNNNEIHANFVQGRSYAKWGNVQVLVLCDMMQIRVYQRTKDNVFDERKYIKYSWADMENSDKYSELKSILS